MNKVEFMAYFVLESLLEDNRVLHTQLAKRGKLEFNSAFLFKESRPTQLFLAIFKQRKLEKERQ